MDGQWSPKPTKCFARVMTTIVHMKAIVCTVVEFCCRCKYSFEELDSSSGTTLTISRRISLEICFFSLQHAPRFGFQVGRYE